MRKLSSSQILSMYEGIWTYNIDDNVIDTKETPIISIYFKSNHKKGYLYQLVLGENKTDNCLYRIDQYNFKQITHKKTGKTIPCLVVKKFRPEVDSYEKELLLKEFKAIAISNNSRNLQKLDMDKKITREFIKKNYLPEFYMTAE